MKTRKNFLAMSAMGFALTISFPAHAIYISHLTFTGVGNVTQQQLTAGNGTSSTSDGFLAYGGGAWLGLGFIKEVVRAEVGGLYVQQKYGVLDDTFAEARFMFPLLLQFRIGNLVLGGGGYMSMGNGNVVTSSSEETYGERMLNKTDFGWLASAGYILTFGAGSRFGLRLEGRFGQSLKNITIVPDPTGKYTILQVLAGLNYEFGGPTL